MRLRTSMRISSTSSSPISLFSIRRSNNAALTKLAMRFTVRTGRLPRSTKGACHSSWPSASTAIKSIVLALISAVLFSSSVGMAFSSPLSIIASTTSSGNASRRAIEVIGPMTPLSMPSATISKRSRSLSSGEYSRTGAETVVSASMAKRFTTFFGTLRACFISSETIARTSGIWSRARVSRISSAILESLSCWSVEISGRRRPSLCASSFLTSSSGSFARIMSACSGVPSLSAISRRTIGSLSLAR